jgi:signal transduction histidine kinase
MAGFGIARGIAKRIEQSEREATRSEQLASIGQLAAGLAHELRNPLTAMRVLVEAGREPSGGTVTGLDGRDLEVLDEEIARLEQLVESFLDFARPPQLEKTKLDVRSLVDQTLHLIGGPARQRGVTVAWQPPTEEVTIEADPVQMRQVLLNLLLNALDATGESGKVTIEIGQVGNLPELVPGENQRGNSQPYIAIHVSDTGPGVPDNQKARIFQPFVSTKDTGMGLGLAVSRRLVEAHGGMILVTDNPSGGARFTICLPHSDNWIASAIASQAGSDRRRKLLPCKPCSLSTTKRTFSIR